MANVNNLPQVQASAMQTAVLPPPAAASAPGAAAARRSFKSFVEAMDDFSFDRRDVAGMRQMLSMRAEAEQAAQTAAKQAPQGAVLRSFAPDQGQPEVPVVRGPAPQAQPQGQPQASARSMADPYAALPKLPSVSVPSIVPPAAGQAGSVQSSAVPALPSLPQQAAAQAVAKAPVTDSGIPLLVLDPAKINPAAGNPRGDRIVGFMPISQTSAAAPVGASAASTAAAAADQDLPPQLRSPMVDQVRAATRGGARPGLSEEAMARMNAAAERRRAMAPPMPPKLMAQESRWNRDAWTATVNGTAPAAGTPSVVPSLPQLPEASVAQASMAQQASVLPRLPGAQ
ncbi:MAG: hypothetical protein JNM30_17240 [Rhodospirillales bacterium]|nr:hypothetical protein [Rhodospirillales bacterium]